MGVVMDHLTTGHGTFGEVRHGWLYGGTEIAVKKAVNMNKERALVTLANEVRLLRRIRHHNIVLFHGVLMSDTDLSLILEWVEGANFEQHIRSVKQRRETLEKPDVGPMAGGHRQKLLTDVARGMQYLHAQPNLILHRDLKPANILVETTAQPPRAKIADFGLSVLVRGAGETDRAGTPAYMAPEVQRGDLYSTAADVFSFGGLAFFALVVQHPSAALVAHTLQADAAAHEGESGGDEVEVLLKVVRLCLQENPVGRPTFLSLLQLLAGTDGLRSSGS